MALSAQTYIGDGINTDFVLDFTLGYISEAHIYVFVDEVEIPQNTLQFINAGGSVRLPTAPANGATVLVRRIVPNGTLIHDYENGALVIEKNLDESNLQAVMLQHESIDGFVSKGAGQPLDMGGFRIIKVGDAIEDDDAVNNRTLAAQIPAIEAARDVVINDVNTAGSDAQAAIASDLSNAQSVIASDRAAAEASIAADVAEVESDRQEVAANKADFDDKYLGEVTVLPSPTGRPEGQLAFLDGVGMRVIENGAWIDATAPVTISPNENLLINGDFSVWQRGTAGNYTGAIFSMTADRWFIYVGSGTATAQEGFGHGAGSQRLGYSVGSVGGATGVQIGQRIESASLAGYAAIGTANLTFSIWAFSSTGANSIDVNLHIPNALDDYTGTTLKAVTALGTPVAGTWGKFEVTIPWDDDFKNGLQVSMVVQGTLQQDLTFSRAKLEIGNVATPFVPDTPQVNLDKCLRYYQKWDSLEAVGVANSYNSFTHGFNLQLVTPMRTTPIVSSYTDLYMVGVGGSGAYGVTSFANQVESARTIYATLGTSVVPSVVAGMALSIRVQSGVTFSLDAELY
jgi:hypothetical protein